MATLKALIKDRYKRRDNTYLVHIRLTHNRGSIYIPTPLYVEASLVTRAFKIKDQRIIDATNAIIYEWRGLIAELGAGADALSAKELAYYLRKRSRDIRGFHLNFIEYIYKVGDKRRTQNTRATYYTVANSLARYTQRENLDIAEVNALFLRDYEAWLITEGVAQGTRHLYMSTLKAAHNYAKFEFNDEDGNIIRVPQSPFAKYKMPQPQAPEARGIDLKTLQAIADLEDGTRIRSARDFGRDIFMLSYALGGMNGADLYNLPYNALKGDYIEYNRQKTKGARADNALYRVPVLPEVRPLLNRWLDPTKKRLFRFHLKYTEHSFVQTIPRSMKLIQEAVPYERNYTFYAARHTYATLAHNVVGCDMYLVNELLNHSDTKLKITARYVERDWSVLFDAHAKVVRLVDWQEICRERG